MTVNIPMYHQMELQEPDSYTKCMECDQRTNPVVYFCYGEDNIVELCEICLKKALELFKKDEL